MSCTEPFARSHTEMAIPLPSRDARFRDEAPLVRNERSVYLLQALAQLVFGAGAAVYPGRVLEEMRYVRTLSVQFGARLLKAADSAPKRD
jgi:hypothetical protein